MERAAHYFFRETDSTNKELWRMIEAGEAPGEGTVVQAGYQTAGRGQAKTHWVSEAGKNLLFSILLKPVFLSPGRQFMLNKCIALSIRDAMASLCQGHAFLIKWPNDILSGGKKIAGTLIENRIMGKTYEISVAGIGVNINQCRFPPGIPSPASLKMLTGKDYDIDRCLQQVKMKIQSYYNMLRQDDTACIDKAYLDNLLGYGERIQYTRKGRTSAGTVAGVNEYGKLLLKDDEGRLQTFGMKEIEFPA